jgi:gluconate kinase
MVDKIKAALDRADKDRQRQLDDLNAAIAAAPDNELAPATLMAAIRCPALQWRYRQDAAKELIKYQKPMMTIHGWAQRLDEAIERTQAVQNGHSAKLIEHRAEEGSSAKLIEGPQPPASSELGQRLKTPLRRRA